MEEEWLVADFFHLSNWTHSPCTLNSAPPKIFEFSAVEEIFQFYKD